VPPAARITDMHVCPMVTGVVPHVGGPILPPCEPTVLIGGLPAARVTDMATCGGPPDIIIMGSPTVLIGKLMAARIGDPTAHGGVIVLGCPTVIIGEAGSPSPSAPSAPVVSDLSATSKGLDGAAANGSDDFKQKLDELYARAPAAKAEIDALASGVAAKHGGKVARTALKSRLRAIQKTQDDYDGDVSKIKDVARNTIVVPAGQESAALDSLRSANPNIKPEDINIIDAESNPLGYSGINVSILTQAGVRAEIQINSPEMIFAKEKPEIAKEILGEATYTRIASAPGLPAGGQGHELYEQWRSLLANSPKRAEIAARSRGYYKMFRR
jgi:uncharacterized Zn-binding protein involved in type VI secretion